jgi:hypothetical protein
MIWMYYHGCLNPENTGALFTGFVGCVRIMKLRPLYNFHVFLSHRGASVRLEEIGRYVCIIAVFVVAFCVISSESMQATTSDRLSSPEGLQIVTTAFPSSPAWQAPQVSYVNSSLFVPVASARNLRPLAAAWETTTVTKAMVQMFVQTTSVPKIRLQDPTIPKVIVPTQPNSIPTGAPLFAAKAQEAKQAIMPMLELSFPTIHPERGIGEDTGRDIVVMNNILTNMQVSGNSLSGTVSILTESVLEASKTMHKAMTQAIRASKCRGKRGPCWSYCWHAGFWPGIIFGIISTAFLIKMRLRSRGHYIFGGIDEKITTAETQMPGFWHAFLVLNVASCFAGALFNASREDCWEDALHMGVEGSLGFFTILTLMLVF